MLEQTHALAALHAGLTQRRLPQHVAAALSDLHLPGLDAKTRNILDKLARHGTGPTSMPQTFSTHPGLHRPYSTAARLLADITSTVGVPALPAADPTDPNSLRVFLTAAAELLGLDADADANPVRATRKVRLRTHSFPSYDVLGEEVDYAYTVRDGCRGRRGDTRGHTDPRDAYTADERRRHLPEVSVRKYRHAVRAVNHLQQRTAVLAAARDREASTVFAKTRLAHTIELGDFSADAHTAAFVAYYVARLAQRTVFTNGAQDRPMDTLSDGLLRAALAQPTVRADVIARVLTRQQILNRLKFDERLTLLALHHRQLQASSRALQRAFDPARDRTRMVARPGDDSSTWNLASRAFNQARTAWLNLAAAVGFEEAVEAKCPGKVPALVAADVVQWHQTSGSDQHADTQVFAALPLPWEVFLNQVPCSAEQVRQACRGAGIDPEESGWTKAYRQPGLAETAAAPELVHGVEVSSAAQAQELKEAGAYAGRASSVAADESAPEVVASE